MDTHIRLTRQELYDKVWSVPISRLAKEYRLSDVGLAKICKRHRIPRPGVGYWARIAHGQTVMKELLPEAAPGESEVIEFSVEANADDAHVANRYEDTRSELARIEQKADALAGGKSGPLKHPLVLALQKIRRELRPDTEGWLSGGRASYLDLRATQGSWDRALRLMDTVLLAAESLGYSVRIEPDKGTVLKVLGEDIPFGLKEKIVRSEAPPPDRSDLKFYPIGKSYEYSPTGLLNLSIKDLYLDKARINWSDTARVRLEDQIEDFFAGVIEAVARLRARRAIWEEEERQSKEAASAHPTIICH